MYGRQNDFPGLADGFTAHEVPRNACPPPGTVGFVWIPNRGRYMQRAVRKEAALLVTLLNHTDQLRPFVGFGEYRNDQNPSGTAAL